MFFDYYLKFKDETEFQSVTFPDNACVDVIGQIPIVDAAGVWTGWEDGWHVNVRSTVEIPEIAAYVITPSPVSPFRVWA